MRKLMFLLLLIIASTAKSQIPFMLVEEGEDVCLTNICKVTTVTTDPVFAVSGSMDYIYIGKKDGIYAYNDYEHGMNLLDSARSDSIRGIDAIDSTVVFIEAQNRLSGKIFKKNGTWASGLSQWTPSIGSRMMSIDIDTSSSNNFMYASDRGERRVRRADIDFIDASFSNLQTYIPSNLRNLSGIVGHERGDDPGDTYGVSGMSSDTAAYFNPGLDGYMIGPNLADSSEITAHRVDGITIRYIVGNGRLLYEKKYSNGFTSGFGGSNYLSSDARDIEIRNDTLYILMQNRIEMRKPGSISLVLTDYYHNTGTGNIDLYMKGRYIYVASENGLIVYEIK